MYTITRRVALLAIATSALAACSGREHAGDSTVVGTMPDSVLPPKTTWSGGAVLAYLTVSTSAETQASSLAQQKGASPAVKAFAQQVIADDNAMLQDIQQVAAKAKVSPEMHDPDVQALIKRANADAAKLAAAGKGAAWDRAYLATQLAEDQSILGKLQDATKSASDAEVKAALDRTIQKVQQHIGKAQELAKS